ncbi:MAG: ABC transporter permease [Eubacterium sp.]|nr:ABC transporter permease [Eubacterium sp.]
MRPFSAIYYIKENKKKSLVIIFMLVLTTLIFLAGNYIDSVYYFWDKNMDYSDELCVISALPTDEDYKEFTEFYNELKKDDKLVVQERTAWGFHGLSWECTMGFEMGTASMVFSSVDDMKTAFDKFGIECDFTDIKEGSVVMSETFAKHYGLKKGDVIDSSLDNTIDGHFTLDALIGDDSFMLFYVIPGDEMVLRINVMSPSMSGHELRDYLTERLGGRKANINSPMRDEIAEQFEPFFYIFFSGIILLSAVLSIIINSVITGQYIRRVYEFGVYRAIGISKGGILRKCASEISVMNLFAVLFGAVIIMTFTFLANELYYIPEGKYLPYFSKIGLIGFLLSNALVVIPTIISKGRGMMKADVTEF